MSAYVVHFSHHSHPLILMVQKWVTLNDPERRNGHFLPYFAEFGSFHCQLPELRKSG